MPAFCEILVAHAIRYPQWKVPDLYKLLHQGVMGSEHAVTDPGHARRWLEDELAHLAPSSIQEPLVDPISPNGAIVRVHLRPFSLTNLDPALLLEAFLQTASDYNGSTLDLEHAWLDARDLCVKELLPFSPQELDTFFTPIRKNGFPAVHHSETYEAFYHPAYRVVARAFLPQKIVE